MELTPLTPEDYFNEINKYFYNYDTSLKNNPLFSHRFHYDSTIKNRDSKLADLCKRMNDPGNFIQYHHYYNTNSIRVYINFNYLLDSFINNYRKTPSDAAKLWNYLKEVLINFNPKNYNINNMGVVSNTLETGEDYINNYQLLYDYNKDEFILSLK